MASPSARESPSPAAWSEVLDHVLQALEHTAREAARLSDALDPPDPPGEPSRPLPPSFDALRAIVGKAEKAVAEGEEQISAEARVVQERLEKLAALGRRLAEGAAGAV